VALVVITNPRWDFERGAAGSGTEVELDRLDAFLAEGGDLFVSLDPYVKSEEDISKAYNLPLLAVIPTVGSRNKKGKYYRSYRAYSGYGRTNTHDLNK
jgi:hypothetical protein